MFSPWNCKLRAIMGTVFLQKRFWNGWPQEDEHPGHNCDNHTEPQNTKSWFSSISWLQDWQLPLIQLKVYNWVCVSIPSSSFMCHSCSSVTIHQSAILNAQFFCVVLLFLIVKHIDEYWYFTTGLKLLKYSSKRGSLVWKNENCDNNNHVH